jgi:hypothetical protein
MNTALRSIQLVAALALSSYALFGCATSPPGAVDAVDESEQAVDENECPAGVPAALVPAPDQTLMAMAAGVGVQIYVCNGVGGWTFVAPQANLLNEDGELVGTHFIGPTWQGNDGSSVVGAKQAGATVDATAIPWLLLTAVAHNGVNGRFSNVTSIQRLSTVGGLAPTSGCDAAHVGKIAQVPYSAEYVFYKARAHGAVTRCGAN